MEKKIGHMKRYMKNHTMIHMKKLLVLSLISHFKKKCWMALEVLLRYLIFSHTNNTLVHSFKIVLKSYCINVFFPHSLFNLNQIIFVCKNLEISKDPECPLLSILHSCTYMLIFLSIVITYLPLMNQ